MNIDEIINNFKRAYSTRNIVRISRSSSGIYVVEAPEGDDTNQETSNMFIGDGVLFVPFNPINDLDRYTNLMSKVSQVWPPQTITHPLIPRRWS